MPGSAAFAAYCRATSVLLPLVSARLRRRFVARGGDPARWPERLGRERAAPPGAPVFWVHAVSVGEMMSALPLVEALLAARPEAEVLLTTTTPSAAELAAGRLPDRARHRFAPLDTPAIVARFLERWRPERAIFLESELWPCQIAALHACGIPLALVSARLTARSTARWRRYAPGLARLLLSRVSLILAQDAPTAERARSLGAPRVEIAGSLKAAAARLPVDEPARAAFAGAIGTRPVWVAASTHAGEEEIVAAAHRRLLARNPAALLILAPRHRDRAPEIRTALSDLPMAFRSEGALPQTGAAVYLADSYGEMGLWFSLAPVVFLGGSLRPGIGGHNPLEPAAFGAALLTGAHTDNAEAEFAALIAAGAAARVTGAEDLADRVAELWRDGAAEMGRAARAHAADPERARDIAARCLALR